MKILQPPKRLVELGLVLQYDSDNVKRTQEHLFSWNERLLINRERARLLAKDTSYRQDDNLENKIDWVLQGIKNLAWKPSKEIRYAKNV